MLYFFIALSIIELVLIIIFKVRSSDKLWVTEHKYENLLSKAAKDYADESSSLNKRIRELEGQVNDLQRRLEPRIELIKVAGSNLTAIPYMAGIMADYETYGIENLAASLNWGYDEKRLKKVKSIREIREDARQIVERNKDAQYQLAYLLELYPGLQDVIETDYQQLPTVKIEALEDRDPIYNYLTKEEYESLEPAERNQLALDRYVASHSKSKWQIGRDYELSIGYQYTKAGAKEVEYTGSLLKLEDLGRDLIVHYYNGQTLIVQCKFWSENKTIHEKHITQLYGTTVSYAMENSLPIETVQGVLVTNTCASDMAKKMAALLGITIREGVPMGEFPRIKCNNGTGEYGERTKIYHLPFDQQYDRVKMIHPADFWAFTTKEAERAGYRRAMRWFGE